MVIVDHFLFDEPLQICCDVLSPLFREAVGLEPADDACCMGINSHPSAAVGPPRGDGTSAADAFKETTFFWQLFFFDFSHRFKSIFSISFIGSCLPSLDRDT